MVQLKPQQRQALQRSILEGQPYESMQPQLQKIVSHSDWQEQCAPLGSSPAHCRATAAPRSATSQQRAAMQRQGGLHSQGLALARPRLRRVRRGGLFRPALAHISHQAAPLPLPPRHRHLRPLPRHALPLLLRRGLPGHAQRDAIRQDPELHSRRDPAAAGHRAQRVHRQAERLQREEAAVAREQGHCQGAPASRACAVQAPRLVAHQAHRAEYGPCLVTCASMRARDITPLPPSICRAHTTSV